MFPNMCKGIASCRFVTYVGLVDTLLAYIGRAPNSKMRLKPNMNPQCTFETKLKNALELSTNIRVMYFNINISFNRVIRY